MKFLFLFISILSSSIILWGQSKDDFKKKYSEAENLFKSGNFKKAASTFSDLVKSDSANANIFYKLGLCYLNIPLKSEEASFNFQKAMNNIAQKNDYNTDVVKCNKAPYDISFFLAQAYHLNHDFDLALSILNDFKSSLKNDSVYLKKTTHEIDMCNNGKEFYSSPVNMKISNLEVPVNSEYSDFSPVVSADESVMIFTSKRKGSTGGKIAEDGQYFEDIYISNRSNNEWSAPKNIGSNINTSGNDESVGISPDGTQLFIYRNDNGDGNIYVSKLVGEKWLKPEKLGSTINSKYNEKQVSISADGNSLFFSSNRPGGFGGYDIYIVKKLPNGEWSEAMNLGSSVNSEYNEQCPYIHPDGSTLFFSSEGHNTMGGYDIFFSSRNDDESWSAPINIGCPINTTYDDLYYTPTSDGKRAYYSSFLREGLGESDICLISTISTVKQLSVLTGHIKLEGSKTSENVEIKISESESKEQVGTYIPNSNTGKFLIIIPPRKNHVIFCDAAGYLPYLNHISLSRKTSYQESENTVSLDTIVLRKTFQFYPFEFLDGDTAINPKFEAKLDLLTEYMKSSGGIIEIIANKSEISESRIKFLKNSFIKEGIKDLRIKNSYSIPDLKNDVVELLLYYKQGENTALNEIKKRKGIPRNEKKQF